MLVLIMGENGSGKTFIMSMIALSQLNRIPLANFEIKHPLYQRLEFDTFLNIPDNSDVYIDEAYRWLENRRSSKASNIYITEIKEQKRKTFSTWYVSEQRPKLIDKRIELFANILIQCKTRYPIGYSKEDFRYKITYEDTNQVVYKRFPYEKAKKYFKYFNTYEKVEVENKQKVEFEMIKQNPNKLMDKVVKLVEIIENDDSITEYTHPSLKYACLKNGIIIDYEPFLYIYLKNKYKKNKGSA